MNPCKMYKLLIQQYSQIDKIAVFVCKGKCSYKFIQVKAYEIGNPLTSRSIALLQQNQHGDSGSRLNRSATMSVIMYSKTLVSFGLCLVRKPTFYICKNKGTDQLRDDSSLNQRLCPSTYRTSPSLS